jgi:ribosomal-protein-alanine N-acetyltransferase
MKLPGSPDAPCALRRATVADSEAIIQILQGVAAEGGYTAITRPWSNEQQRRYIALLSPREAIHVAETEAGTIAGYQTLDLWAPTLQSMAHVGQIGTFLRPEWRGRGLGAALFQRTVDFACGQDYSKLVIQVRAGNGAALRFYRRLGFRECGRLSRQVRVHESEEDEILMEFFL